MGKQKGAATLILAVILLAAVVLIMVFAANHSRLQQKTGTNQYSNAQAFQAAEAGLSYGMAYLNENQTTIKSTASGGFINYGSSIPALTNVALANNSRWSVVFTNPTANNYNTILVTATGVSADGTSTRVIRQFVYAGTSVLQSSLTTQGNLSLSGTSDVVHGANIGGSLATSGNATIDTYQDNNSTLAGMSASDLFRSIFGQTPAQMQSQASYYANSSGVNWSTLSGIVWINSNTSITGNNVIGSTANPVLLIVNGSLTGTGTATINGVVYVMNTTSIIGTFTINGALISQGNVNMNGTSNTYNQSIVNQFTLLIYTKVSGSWRDF